MILLKISSLRYFLPLFLVGNAAYWSSMPNEQTYHCDVLLNDTLFHTYSKEQMKVIRSLIMKQNGDFKKGISQA